MSEQSRSPFDPYEHQHLPPIVKMRLETLTMVDKAAREFTDQSNDIHEKLKLLAEQIQEETQSRDSLLNEIQEFRERVDELEKMSDDGTEDANELEQIREVLDDMLHTAQRQVNLSEKILDYLRLESEMREKEQQITQRYLVQVKRLQAKHSGIVETIPEHVLYPSKEAKHN